MHQPLSLLSFKALFSFKLKGDFLSLEILYTGDLKNGLNHTRGFLVGKGSLREGGEICMPGGTGEKENAKCTKECTLSV